MERSLTKQRPRKGIRPEFEFQRLLVRVSKLPIELRHQILQQISPDTLNQLCQGLDKATFGNLVEYCSNANFWRDLVLEQGYDLPEGFPTLINMMRTSHKDTEAEVIKDFFFRDFNNFWRRKRIFVQRLKCKYPSSSPEQDQLILDAEYLNSQVEHRIHTAGDRKLIFYPLNFWIPRAPEVPLPTRITYAQLLQLLINSDYSLSEPLLLMWFGYPEIEIDNDLQRSINEQRIAMLPLFLREGDIVGPVELYSPFHHYSTINYYYVYGQGNQQILVKLEEIEQRYFLPNESGRFLRQNDIKSLSDLRKLYKMTSIDIAGWRNPSH